MTPGTIDLQPDALETSQLPAECFSETGWHEELIEQPDGTVEIVWTPLTAAEFLHRRQGLDPEQI